MDDDRPPEITRILERWSTGDDEAKEELLRFVYEDLKRHARQAMARERSGHTLQPTALVHEAFLRMGEADGVVWENRAHFFAIASRLMRQILVDHARKRTATKRGNRPIHISLDELQVPIEERAAALVALDEGLRRLAEMDVRQAGIVELKFFGGLSNTEIAEHLDISERTVAREWTAAKLWLYRELNS